MKIVEVTTPKQAKEFVLFQPRLLKNEPAYIRPLDKDIEGVFHKKTNRTLRNGKVIRWLLIDDKGKTIGRVAAFVNNKTVNKDNDQPTGGMGFFDCINSRESAFMLFDTCKEWLVNEGMEAMDGPVNFGERDRWWGLQVDGFDREPNYCCNYNPPYYQELFEAYGFKLYFKQFTFGRPVMDPLSERVIEKAKLIAQDPDYSFRHMRLKELAKYTEDFRTIYNKAWGKHAGVTSLSEKQAKALIGKMKPLIDEKIMWFGYYKDDPVSFFLSIPEFNQIVKHLNGKLDLIGKLKFLYHKKMQTVKKSLGIVFGVVPEHQGKGVEGAMISASRVLYQDEYKRYEDIEMNWIGDFNPKMLKVVEQVGGKVVKTHHTYRKLFDESKPFRRATIKN